MSEMTVANLDEDQLLLDSTGLDSNVDNGNREQKAVVVGTLCNVQENGMQHEFWACKRSGAFECEAKVYCH